MTDSSVVPAAIPTARGDTISSDSLGFTLMHEHTFNLSPEINQNYPETWGDEDQRIENAIAQYTELKAQGVDTIVDVTVIGLGRFIPRIKRIAEAVSLNIIVATGVYTWQMLPMFFSVQGPGTPLGGPETMDDLFVRDIEEGIADTGVRAGILKVATDKYGLTEGVERVLRATASAHRRTGVPITTHTHDVPNGLEQQRVFEEEGVDLSRVVIGHCDLAASHDLAYARALMDAGSFIGIDQFGTPNLDDKARISAIVALCQEGYSDKIVVSHDHNCYCDMVPSAWFADMPSWRKTLIPTEIVPELLRQGVSADDVEKLTRLNPRKVFGTTALGKS
jgi:phosphotriesterase-related protein